MPETQWREEIVRPVRTLQIVTVALVTGCVVFLAVAMFIRLGENDPAQAAAPVPTFGYALLVFVATALLARAIAPRWLVSAARRKIAEGTWKPPQQTGGGSPISDEFLAKTGDAGKLCCVFMTKTVVGAALLEGAAFFSLIAYLAEGATLSLAMAAGLIIAVALHFPTLGRAVGWIERQLSLLDQQRQWET
ncbi:MAG: hypothetical protein HQ581_04910 [Planctomycetes bacterium]|nr:hypothetical protein [Planctomycetota bacterium]